MNLLSLNSRLKIPTRYLRTLRYALELTARRVDVDGDVQAEAQEVLDLLEKPLKAKPSTLDELSEVAKELRYYADKADAKTAERMEQIAARVERLSRNQTEKKQIKKRRV